MYLRILRNAVRKSKHPQLSSFLSQLCTTKASTPLRILFCGSDDFSSASLRALYAEHKRDSQLIASIDVLCRPGKPSGRSMTHIRQVPIKAVAQELGLAIHERDTFTGWELPRPQDESINLIVAVSFGLFVPPRILNSAEYGGLNVHPSLLPDFQGPAPLQHTIMSGAGHTGVTLQTLDDKSFDQGLILAQTPPTGLQIPSPHQCKYSDLLQFITPKAAEILVQGIRDRVFIPPLVNAGWYKPKTLTMASKITSEDRHVNWSGWNADIIERRYRALGRLWSNLLVDSTTTKRFVFEDFEIVPMPEILAGWLKKHKEEYAEVKENRGDNDGVRFMVYSTPSGERNPQFFVVDQGAIIIASHGGNALKVREITVEGKGKQAASKGMKGIQEWKEWRLQKGKYEFFLAPARPMQMRSGAV